MGKSLVSCFLLTHSVHMCKPTILTMQLAVLRRRAVLFSRRFAGLFVYWFLCKADRKSTDEGSPFFFGKDLAAIVV